MMSTTQRRVLERVAKSKTAAHREVVRASVLLDAAAGVPNTAIASRHQVTAVSVRKWRAQFQQQGLTDWGKVAPDAAASPRSRRRRSRGSWS